MDGDVEYFNMLLGFSYGCDVDIGRLSKSGTPPLESRHGRMQPAVSRPVDNCGHDGFDLLATGKKFVMVDGQYTSNSMHFFHGWIDTP
jgi:hypothetical protein